MPRISIITIYRFGDVDELAKTISSIQNQSFKEFELILILSNYNQTIRLDFLNSSTNLKKIINKDNSLYNAMNIGIQAATGDFVIFLNGGDKFYDKRSLDKIMSQNLSEFNLFASGQVYENDCYLRSVNIRNDKVDAAHQSAIVSTQLARQCQFNEHQVVMADQQWLQALFEKNGVTIFRDVVSLFELGGVSNSPTFRTVKLRLYEQGLTRAIKETIKLLLSKALGPKIYYRVIYFRKYKRIKYQRGGENVNKR